MTGRGAGRRRHPARWCAVTSFALLATTAFAFDAVPRAPLEPTAEDCRQLDSAFYRMLNQLHQNMAQCLRQQPRFGPGHVRHDCPGFNGGGTVAWVQCESIQDDICALDVQQTREAGVCRDRARQVAARDERNRKAQDERIDQLVRVARRGETIAGAAAATIQLVNDPKRFLTKVLGSTENKALLRRMFPPGGPGSQADTTDGRVAEEVYRYANQTAKYGLSKTPDPITRYLQQRSLDAINAEYAHVFGQLDGALADMKAFDAKLASPEATFAPVAVPLPSRPSGDGDAGCSLLDSFERSSRLAADDPKRFNELMRRCTKG